MTTLKISKGKLPEVIHLPSSKSYANRALILAAVTKGPVTIQNLPQATDVSILVDALKKLNLSIDENGNSITIKNSFPECEKAGKEIAVGEGGTTARFLAVLLTLGSQEYVLRLGKRLKERPWTEFLDCARSLGICAELQEGKLSVAGPVNSPAELRVNCARTTQFATAFDLVLSDTKIIPDNLSASESYWKMNGPLKAHFKTHDSYLVPADWSSAAFPMAFASLNQSISFPNLAFDEFQADAKILAILKSLGAVKSELPEIVVGEFTDGLDLNFDMSDCLDLFPALTFMLAHITGVHTLSGLKNLAHKESDRLKEMTGLLHTFERKFDVKENSILIYGNESLCGEKHLDLPDDHRIVMAAALFLRHHSGGTLTNSESVNKSYPDFFELLK
jgi:3-phosphoshikimate 1-carboxyvinyltransferase